MNNEVIKTIKDKIKNDWRILLYSGLIYIQDKSSQVVPFIPNKVQERIINKIWQLEQDKKPVRLLIPKARQHGVTTLVMCIMFAKTTFQDNLNCVVLAHINDASTEIFSKTEVMYNELSIALKPLKFKSNTKELKYYNGSKIKVKSAESKRQRSFTAQFLLCSEVAFYSDTEKLMTGLLQTIPDIPGTTIIMESTGNGIGDYFYNICKKAEQKQNIYELIFIAWFENNEYQMEIPENYNLDISESGKYGDEIYYKNTFNLTDKQMYWRRYTIDNKLEGNLMDFMQEYPATLDECFIASGLPVFDIMKLNELEKTCISPKRTCYLKDNILTDSINGWLKIFKGPDEFKNEYKNRFSVTLDTGGVWSGADYSIAVVFDRLKKEVVAIARGHFESYEFADIAVSLCKLYYNAWLIIEINKWSSETEDETSLLDNIINHIKYSYLYKRQIYDKISEKYTQKIGFHTNSSTKRLIVDKLRKIINENENYKINDIEIIKEMKTYIIAKSKTGRTQYEAQEGCKDDRVMATGISFLIDEELPKVQLIEKKIKKTYTSNPYSVF